MTRPKAMPAPAPAERPVAWVAALAAVTAATWGASLQNGFVFDDAANVQGNPWIRDWRLLPEAFMHHAAGFDANYSTSFYRPLMHVFYAVAWAVAGDRPWAFHLLNVALHVTAVVCVFWLVRAVVERWGSADRHACVPVVAALVFALHPVHTEPVLWVAGITDLSYAVFGLLALLVYVRAFDRPGSSAGAAALLLLSLLSKETGAAVFALMLVLEWIEQSSGRRWTSRDAVGRVAAPAGAVAVYVAMRLWALGSFAPSAAQHSRALLDLVACAGELVARYTGLLIAPLTLTVMRDTRLAGTFSSPLVILGLAIVAALLAAAAHWRRSPLVVLAIGVSALPVLPALYVPAIESGSSIIGERYLYLPVLGLGIAAGAALEHGARRWRWGRTAGAALLCGFSLWGVSSALAHVRVWSSALALWTDAVEKAPGSAAAHEGLCFALYQQARYAEALDACGRALAIEPGRADALTNHATALLALGRPAQAKRELDEVLARHPRSPEALINRGLACMMLGAHDEALASYRRAIEVAPLHAEAHNVLGVALARLGRPADGLAEIEAAVRLAPDNTEYRANLDSLRRRVGPM